MKKNRKTYSCLSCRYNSNLNFAFLSIILILLSFLFTSCKDNPVSPPYQFDAPRYSWDLDTLYTEVFSIWGYDTNCVLYLTRGSLIKYDGNSYNELFVFGGYFNTICGVNENNTYIGGGNSIGRPQIWKWNGQYLENIPVPDPSGREYSLYWGYAVSENEIWFGSQVGRLLQYYNGQFKFFDFDTSFSVTPIMTGLNNKLYIATTKLDKDSVETYYMNIYERDNENWIKIWSKILANGEEGVRFRPIKNQLIGTKTHSIHKFINNEFSLIHNVNEFRVSNNFDGTTENELLVYGSTLNGHSEEDYGFLHWNGNSWSFEYNINFTLSTGIGIRKIKDRYYCILFQYPWATFIFKGIEK